MVFDIAIGYVDPGTYVQELIVPGGANVAGLPFTTTLIGCGDRNKSITNEAILRASVKGEVITPAPTSPHIAAISLRTNRQIGTTAVHRIVGGISSTLPDGLISFGAASATGSATGPYNIATNNAIALAMDGITPVTLVMYPRQALVASSPSVPFTTFPAFRVPAGPVTLTATTASAVITGSPVTVTVIGTDAAGAPQTGTFLGVATGSATVNLSQGILTWGSITSITSGGAVTGGAISIGVLADAVSISGRQISTGTALTSLGAAATRGDVAAAINLGLSNASSLGFGSAYASAASGASTSVVVTSPVTTAASDVRVFVAPTTSATATIFGSAFINAASVITIADSAWSGTATWTIDYVEAVDTVLYPSAAVVTDFVDGLANANVQSVSKVGTFAGAGNFVAHRDYIFSSQNIDWSVLTSAVLTGVAAPPSGFDLSSGNSIIQLSIDGQALITVDIVSQANPPIGYVSTLTASAVSASQAAVNINAILAQQYGPRYANVASAVSTALVLTSPSTGFASSILIAPPSSGSAVLKLFGLSASTTNLGVGYVPAAGTIYYASYSFTRPASDYNKPLIFFDPTTAKAQVGQVSASIFNYNPLAKAIEIAFLNGSAQIYLIQVNDSTTPGSPTRNEVDTALQAAEMLDEMTEISIIDAPGCNVAIQTDELNHVETQCSPTEKHYRRGWYGMLTNTPIGDVQTAGSFVYTATQTLQTSASSPGRGRAFLVAPPQQAGVSRDFQLDDGSTVRLPLDSTYLGVAASARRTSLLSPADTLTRRTLNGFNVDDIVAPWRKQERALLAGNGCLVVTLEGGRLIMLDPVSTEAGGAGQLEFKQDSSSYQKDNVTRKITKSLDANIIGIVPFDLANFIIDIKLIIAGVLSNEVSAGSIGPYRNSSGVVRAINPLTDITVAQSTTDATKYFFGTAYNLRYPALRIFGQYVVDSPFQSLNG